MWELQILFVKLLERKIKNKKKYQSSGFMVNQMLSNAFNFILYNFIYSL